MTPVIIISSRKKGIESKEEILILGMTSRHVFLKINATDIM